MSNRFLRIFLWLAPTSATGRWEAAVALLTAVGTIPVATTTGAPGLATSWPHHGTMAAHDPQGKSTADGFRAENSKLRFFREILISKFTASGNGEFTMTTDAS